MGPGGNALHGIHCVMVTYNTGAAVNDPVSGIIDQVEHVILVDNNSDENTITALEELSNRYSSKLTILRNQKNMGLAHALNQGVRTALDRGADWILTLDHDSRPAPDMVRRMLSVYAQLQGKEDIAVVAPRPVDRITGADAAFQKFGRLNFWIRCGDKKFIMPDLVITSGSMTKSSVFREIGLFDERLFIDCIDHEYCLRLRKRGFVIGVACDAVLYHSLGKMEKRKFLGRTFYPTNHAPSRWYYMARNRVYLYTKYWKNLWYIYVDGISFLESIIKLVLFETEKGKKLGNALRGFADGLLRRL